MSSSNLHAQIKKYKAEFKKWSDKLNQSSVLLRKGILGLVVVVILLIWKSVVYDEVSSLTKEVKDKVIAEQLNLAQEKKDLTRLTEEISNYNADEIKKNIEEAQSKIKSIDKSLEKHKSRLVKPADMSKIVESIMLHAKDVKIEKITWLAIEKIDGKGKTSLINAESLLRGKSKDVIYRHGLKLSFLGDYHASLRFINKIEGSEWPLLLEELKYKVKTHPEAGSEIVIKMISDSNESVE